jgi:hypothetical protein
MYIVAGWVVCEKRLEILKSCPVSLENRLARRHQQKRISDVAQRKCNTSFLGISNQDGQDFPASEGNWATFFPIKVDGRHIECEILVTLEIDETESFPILRVRRVDDQHPFTCRQVHKSPDHTRLAVLGDTGDQWGLSRW